MSRLWLALALSLGACVPELGRVLPDRGPPVDDLPGWQQPDQPTRIGVIDAAPSELGIPHGTADLGGREGGKVDQRPPDQRPPDSPPAATGKWYQANQKNCPSHCGSLGKSNAAGPEGAHCMSGEARSGSGIAQGITFPWGCFSSCAPMGAHQATSDGTNCYMPGQKKDGDPTDRTVGCFCK